LDSSQVDHALDGGKGSSFIKIDWKKQKRGNPYLLKPKSNSGALEVKSKQSEA